MDALSNTASTGTETGARGARTFAHACLTFALWVVLGFGFGMAAIVSLPSVLGYQSLTVVSGSMVPTLGVGSIVIDEVIAPVEHGRRHRHLQGPAPPAPAHTQTSEGARGGRYVLHDHPGRRERRA